MTRSARLIELDRLPERFLQASPASLHELLGGPALIHLPGRRTPAVFVSVLLHGNERTGLDAIQRVLEGHRERAPERSLSIFVGNVAAAAQGARRLDHQQDYNRVWPGADDGGTPEHALAERVTAIMRDRGVFASIDIHNNTGTNPLYGCITSLDRPFLHLAALFGRTAVYFRTPRGVQAAAFATFAPSITVECGKPGSEPGVTRAAELMQAALRLDHFPQHAPAAHDLDLYHTVAVIKVPYDMAFGFGPGTTPIELPPDFDHMNFRELEPGRCIARLAPGARLDVRDESGAEVLDAWFRIENGRLITRRRVMPAMLTLDPLVVRQDCLGYLMERLPLPRR